MEEDKVIKGQPKSFLKKLKEKITKFLNNKIKKWKENRKKKRDSLQSSKKI